MFHTQELKANESPDLDLSSLQLDQITGFETCVVYLESHALVANTTDNALHLYRMASTCELLPQI